MFKTADKLIN